MRKAVLQTFLIRHHLRYVGKMLGVAKVAPAYDNCKIISNTRKGKMGRKWKPKRVCLYPKLCMEEHRSKNAGLRGFGGHIFVLHMNQRGLNAQQRKAPVY